MRKTIAIGMLLIPAMFALSEARASDFDGAWANKSDACDRLYIRKGGQTSFARNADMYGSGFIIDGKQIRGKMAKCSVRATKREGDVAHLVAACSTDIAVDTVQFTFKIIDQDTVTRIFPGLTELNTTYVRCPAAPLNPR